MPATGDNPVRWSIPSLFAQNAQALALSVGHILRPGSRPLTLPICAVVTLNHRTLPSEKIGFSGKAAM
jgi:hypothetical protein